MIILVLLPCETRSNSVDQVDKSFIIRNEGIVLHPYDDIAGYRTYCIGRLAAKTSLLKDHYTIEECEDLLDYDLEKFSEGINECLERELNDYQYTAVMDFAYNLGVSAFCESTLHRVINGDPTSPDIEGDFLVWDKVDIKGKYIDNKAIRARRLREYNLFKHKNTRINPSKYSK